MSQSDYIKSKRMHLILQDQIKLAPILSSSFYTESVSYEVDDHKLFHSTGCVSSFIVCNNTDKRINRMQSLPCMNKYFPIKVKKDFKCCK